jgi:hypothetical protein
LRSGEAHARLAQEAPIFRDALQRTPRCSVLPVPDQPVEPRDMILGTQIAGITSEDRVLLGGLQIPCEPKIADEAACRFRLSRCSKDIGETQLAHRRDGRVLLEIGLEDGIGDIFHGLLGAAAKHILCRPLGVMIDKIGDVGESRHVAPRQLQPEQDLCWGSLRRRCGTSLHRRPSPRARCGEGGLIGMVVIGRHEFGDRPVGAKEKEEGGERDADGRHQDGQLSADDRRYRLPSYDGNLRIAVSSYGLPHSLSFNVSEVEKCIGALAAMRGACSAPYSFTRMLAVR